MIYGLYNVGWHVPVKYQYDILIEVLSYTD